MFKESAAMVKARSRLVAVVGGSDSDAKGIAMATDVGRAIARAGAVLVCGGLSGLMEAAARGAKEQGGLTVGILPTYDRQTANRYIDIPIPTGLGHARNIVVAASGDLVIALPGSHGTRSELSFALALGKPVFGVGAWSEIQEVRFMAGVEGLTEKICLFFEQSLAG